VGEVWKAAPIYGPAWIISVANVAYRVIIPPLVKSERHPDTGQEEMALVVKLGFAQFASTCLLIFVFTSTANSSDGRSDDTARAAARAAPRAAPRAAARADALFCPGSTAASSGFGLDWYSQITSSLHMIVIITATCHGHVLRPPLRHESPAGAHTYHLCRDLHRYSQITSSLHTIVIISAVFSNYGVIAVKEGYWAWQRYMVLKEKVPKPDTMCHPQSAPSAQTDTCHLDLHSWTL